MIAAWLAYLKSRLLLPDPEPEQADDIIDMTDALRYQLVRLESMQSAAKRLTDLPLLNRYRMVRGQPEQFERKEQIVWQARLYDLLSAYGGMVSSDEAEKLTIAATRLYSVQEAAGRLQSLLPRTPGWAELSAFLPANLSRHLTGGLLLLLILSPHWNWPRTVLSRYGNPLLMPRFSSD